MDSDRPLGVLLVEDNPADAKLIQEILRAAVAVRLVWLESLATALSRLAQPGIGLVLLDLGLPDSQGLETVTQVVRAHPALPVIVLTGRDDDAVARATLTAGAQDYLVKGMIEPGVLLRAIQYAYERKRSEVALREANEFTNQIVLSVQGGIAVYDRELRYRVWNPYMESLAGVSAEKVVGRHVLEVFPFLREVGVVDALERALEGEVVSIPEIPYRVPESGRQSWTAATFGPLRNVSGAIIGVIGSVQDVTAHKQEEAERGTLEAQLRHAQRMESIGRLAGGVAHDFNNLLSPIMGYAEMLQMHLSPGDPNREAANQILQAAARARDLTRQLLAFSRKQVLALTLVDLRSVVAGFEKLLRRTLREDIRIVFHLPAVLGTVHADAGQIEQVLMNLAVNAQDAMPGGGTLTLALSNVHLDGAYAEGHPGVTPGPYVLLAASDTGIGMDPATQSRLFEPFFTTKEQGKGTGLGLSTVYGIIKQHRGHLWVDSELGRGTTFRIYLPQVGDLAIAPSALPGGTAPLRRGSETVLVVENNPAVRVMVCQVLELHGYRVLVADSGTRGLEVSGAHQGPIDLLLTAVILPDLNGPALYEHLAVGRPGLKAIYTSGYTGDVFANHGVPDDGTLLQKPFPMHTLLQKIREILPG